MAAASASASAATTDVPPRFLQTRTVTLNERNRKAEKLRAATPEFPPDKEVQWHMVRIENVSDASAAIVFLTVALSYPELWMAMARAIPWLGRHSVKRATRWHTWNYFCDRMPVTYSRNNLTRTLRRGWKHGISLERSTLTCQWRKGYTITMSFAGQLANLGPVTPATVKLSQQDSGHGRSLTTVSMAWSNEFQWDRAGNIVGIKYEQYSDMMCNDCKTKGALSDVIVTRRGYDERNSTKKYTFICQTCCYANYRMAACVGTYTSRGPTIATILSNIMSNEELEVDALMRKYQEFIDDGDFDLPQQHWRIKKKPVISPEVLEERKCAREQREAARAAALETKRKARVAAARKRKAPAAARAKRAAQKTKGKRTVASASKREPRQKRTRKD